VREYWRRPSRLLVNCPTFPEKNNATYFFLPTLNLNKILSTEGVKGCISITKSMQINAKNRTYSFHRGKVPHQRKPSRPFLTLNFNNIVSHDSLSRSQNGSNYLMIKCGIQISQLKEKSRKRGAKIIAKFHWLLNLHMNRFMTAIIPVLPYHFIKKGQKYVFPKHNIIIKCQRWHVCPHFWKFA